MGWFAGYILASLVAAVIAVKIFDYIVGGATSGLLSVARAGLFTVTWTAVTVRSGMHGFTSQVRQLRQGNTKAIEALTKVSGPSSRQ